MLFGFLHMVLNLFQKLNSKKLGIYLNLKYLCNLISIKEPTGNLRSNTSAILQRRKTNTVTYGQRSFFLGSSPTLEPTYLMLKIPHHSIISRILSRLLLHQMTVITFLYLCLYLCTCVLFNCSGHWGLATE